ETDLGIKYGRTRYDLEGGGLEHQSVLRSPNATLAVRGTRVSLYDQRPFTPQAVSLTGRAQFQALHRQVLAFGNRGQGRARDNAGRRSRLSRRASEHRAKRRTNLLRPSGRLAKGRRRGRVVPGGDGPGGNLRLGRALDQRRRKDNRRDV